MAHIERKYVLNEFEVFTAIKDYLVKNDLPNAKGVCQIRLNDGTAITGLVVTVDTEERKLEAS